MKLITHLVLLISLIACGLSSTAQIAVKGEKKLWHKVTLEIQGPQASESETPSPFLEYKLTGIFTKGSARYEVPGYFAADGNAANTGATSGNVWRVHFTPPETGTWNYTVRFRKGTNVSVAENIAAGSAVYGLDNKTGSFSVANTDKTGKDLRSKGRLSYVNEHHLRFGNGEWFMKAGPDAPENLLAYQDFDNTPNNKNLRKSYSSHVKDWKNGDPTWGNGKGKGLIGAINYLSGKGMNTISFLTMNAPLGDDRNVFMWINTNKKQNYDCSKLDQWEVIFTHAQSKGMHLHFKTQETENELILDNGNLGNTRKLYYRELVARYAHHLALNWNICEEGGASWSKTNQSQTQRKASIGYIASIDPYANNVVLHTAPNMNGQKAIYNDMLGNKSSLTGVSLQMEWKHVYDCTKHWIDASKNAGKKWVVANDEQGSAKIGVPEDSYTGTPNKHDIRKQTLWGNMMAGGAGVEYYFGYERPHSDLNCQDFRTRDQSWTYAKHALDFFNLYVPYWGMTSDESKTNKGWCLYKDGVSYVVYLPSGGNPTVKLKTGKTYNVKWYNPRNGGALVSGKTNISGGNIAIGNAPDGNDWVALIQATGYTHTPNGPSTGGSTPSNDKVTGVSLNKISATITKGATTQLSPTVYPSSAANKAVTWTSSNSAIASVNASGLVTGKSAGVATITVKTVDGNKTATAQITVVKESTGGGNSGVTIGENYVAIEAEATPANLGKWVKRTPSDPAYYAGSGLAPINDTYLEFTGNNENSGPATSPLTYTFTCPKTGSYRMVMRMYQALKAGEADDKRNDVYVKMAGDFTSASVYSTDDLKHNHKFWGRGVRCWGSAYNAEGHVDGQKKLAPLVYNLKAGKEYTFTLSGRAQGTCIDYILFYENKLGLKVGANIDLAAQNDPKYRPGASSVTPDPTPDPTPGDCDEVRAVDFDKYTGISGFTNAKTDKKAGKDILQIADRLKTAAAQYRYNGANTNVTFKLNTMLEKDGECVYKVKVNGALVGEVQNRRIYGTSTEDYTIQTHVVNSDAYAIKSGDLIQVEFTNATNGLVPEGNKTATARGRWYSLEICSEGTVVDPDPTPTSGEMISISTLPESLTAPSQIDVTIAYIASEQRDIVAIFDSPEGTWLSNAKTTVNAGSGEVTLSIPVNNLPVQDNYKVTAVIREVGTNWDGNIKVVSQTMDIVAVQNQTVEMSPIQDANVEGSNGNNAAIIRVEKGRRIGYLQFDLSDLSGNVAEASLSLTVSGDAGSGQIAIYKGASSNWAETSLNSGNAPSKGVKLATLGAAGTAHNIGKECTFSLNASDIITGGTLNLIVMMEGTSNDLAFASKEHATVSIRPMLTITTGTTKSTSIICNAFEENVLTSVYPNPFIEYVKVSNQDASITAINVFDITGQKIVEKVVSEMETEIQLEGSLFTTPGLYLLQLVRPTGVEMVKVIKK